MIHCVLILNNFGNPRLVKFYSPLDIQSQQSLIKQVNELLANRSPTQSNFLTLPELLKGGSEDELRVIYRLYATLNFIFVVDKQESDLGILDLIQVFVEALDKCFANVCELDIVFGWEVLQAVLEEIVQGGMVLETNVNAIVEAVDRNNNQQTSGPGGAGMISGVSTRFGELLNEGSLSYAGRALADATSSIRSFLPYG